MELNKSILATFCITLAACDALVTDPARARPELGGRIAAPSGALAAGRSTLLVPVAPGGTGGWADVSGQQMAWTERAGAPGAWQLSIHVYDLLTDSDRVVWTGAGVLNSQENLAFAGNTIAWVVTEYPVQRLWIHRLDAGTSALVDSASRLRYLSASPTWVTWTQGNTVLAHEVNAGGPIRTLFTASTGYLYGTDVDGSRAIWSHRGPRSVYVQDLADPLSVPEMLPVTTDAQPRISGDRILVGRIDHDVLSPTGYPSGVIEAFSIRDRTRELVAYTEYSYYSPELFFDIDGDIAVWSEPTAGYSDSHWLGYRSLIGPGGGYVYDVLTDYDPPRVSGNTVVRRGDVDGSDPLQRGIFGLRIPSGGPPLGPGRGGRQGGRGAGPP